MVKTLGVVHIGRQGLDSVLSRRFAERRLGGKPLLEWVVRRVTDSQHIDRTVVVVGEDTMYQRLSQVVPPDVGLFRAESDNALASVNAAAKQFAADSLVIVDLESPFVDPALIDRLIVDAERHQSDYASYCIRSDRGVLASRLGMVAEWCRASAVDQADRNASSAIERMRVTPYLYSHPEEFKIRLIPVPKELDRNDIRLAIHGEDDWHHAQLILDALDPDDLDWQHIAGLLDSQPDIRKDMKRLNETTGDLAD